MKSFAIIFGLAAIAAAAPYLPMSATGPISTGRVPPLPPTGGIPAHRANGSSPQGVPYPTGHPPRRYSTPALAKRQIKGLLGSAAPTGLTSGSGLSSGTDLTGSDSGAVIPSFSLPTGGLGGLGSGSGSLPTGLSGLSSSGSGLEGLSGLSGLGSSSSSSSAGLSGLSGLSGSGSGLEGLSGLGGLGSGSGSSFTGLSGLSGSGTGLEGLSGLSGVGKRQLTQPASLTLPSISLPAGGLSSAFPTLPAGGLVPKFNASGFPTISLPTGLGGGIAVPYGVAAPSAETKGPFAYDLAVPTPKIGGIEPAVPGVAVPTGRCA